MNDEKMKEVLFQEKKTHFEERNLAQERSTKRPYIEPKMEIFYVALDEGFTVSSVRISTASGAVQEDWGNENYDSSDISF